MPLLTSGVVSSLTRYRQWAGETERALGRQHRELVDDIATLDRADVTPAEFRAVLERHRVRVRDMRVGLRNYIWYVGAIITLVYAWGQANGTLDDIPGLHDSEEPPT